MLNAVSDLNRMMGTEEKPLGVAIIVCDKVITEAFTNNKTLISIFNTVNALAFPCPLERMSVYVALTSGQGKRKIGLALKRTSDGTTLLNLSSPVEFESPNAVVEMVFALQHIIFTAPGLYSFEVSADDAYIFESRFNVMQINADQ